MAKKEQIDEIVWDKDAEDKLFAEILAANKHITASQHTLLRAWCRIQLKIDSMAATRELLRYTQESRLLGSSLKLMPDKKENATTDLTTAIREAVQGHDQ